jgi:hypothetical protein
MAVIGGCLVLEVEILSILWCVFCLGREVRLLEEEEEVLGLRTVYQLKHRLAEGMKEHNYLLSIKNLLQAWNHDLSGRAPA